MNCALEESQFVREGLHLLFEKNRRLTECQPWSSPFEQQHHWGMLPATQIPIFSVNTMILGLCVMWSVAALESDWVVSSKQRIRSQIFSKVFFNMIVGRMKPKVCAWATEAHLKDPVTHCGSFLWLTSDVECIGMTWLMWRPHVQWVVWLWHLSMWLYTWIIGCVVGVM